MEAVSGEMPTKPPGILVVEDDPVIRGVVESQLRTHGYVVTAVGTAGEAIQEASVHRPDLLILDLTLDADGVFDAIRDGFAVLAWLRRKLQDCNFPVVIHTGDHSPRVDERAQAEGIFAVVRKGAGAQKLLETVQQTLEHYGMQSS